MKKAEELSENERRYLRAKSLADMMFAITASSGPGGPVNKSGAGMTLIQLGLTMALVDNEAAMDFLEFLEKSASPLRRAADDVLHNIDIPGPGWQVRTPGDA